MGAKAKGRPSSPGTSTRNDDELRLGAGRGQKAQCRDAADHRSDLLDDGTGLVRGLLSPGDGLRVIHTDTLLEDGVGVLDGTVDLALDLSATRNAAIEGDQPQGGHRGRSGQAAGAPTRVVTVTTPVPGGTSGRRGHPADGQCETDTDAQQLLRDSHEFPPSESFDSIV